jgi:predicted transcriptional regulator
MKPDPSIYDEPDGEADQAAIAEGLADVAAGRVVPHTEVKKWLQTWGKPGEKPAPAKWFK